MATLDISVMREIGGIIVPTFGDRSIAVSGLDKLTPMVIKYFITEEGSDPYNKAYGTQLVGMLGTNGADVTSLEEVLQDSIEKTRAFFEVKRTTAIIEGSPLPDDETLGAFELLSYELEVDYLNLYVSISNNLGETKTLNLEIT